MIIEAVVQGINAAGYAISMSSKCVPRFTFQGLQCAAPAVSFQPNLSVTQYLDVSFYNHCCSEHLRVSHCPHRGLRRINNKIGSKGLTMKLWA
ncbi:hypothetical protein J6590_102602 [Homalodisca vitripennis]|nr:hypothetical protein J6590_102602 [Homalodisca vitripennis]